jgi:hypothetical protein
MKAHDEYLLADFLLLGRKSRMEEESSSWFRDGFSRATLIDTATPASLFAEMATRLFG